MTGSGARITLVLALATLLSSPGSSEAKSKKKGAGAACEIEFLPLVQGSEWTYEHFTPADAPAPVGVVVNPPDKLTVKVVAIAKDGAQTRITVEESYRKVTVQSELVCTEDHLLVPPQSFFFSGEPGGGIGLVLDKLETKGESFLLDKGLKEDTMQELKAVAVRTPAAGSGATIPPAHLEIERRMMVRGSETTQSVTAEHKAIRVDIQITGRAALESQKDKPFNMPAVDSAMWFEPGTGVVRVESKAGHGWKLAEHKLPGA